MFKWKRKKEKTDLFRNCVGSVDSRLQTTEMCINAVVAASGRNV